MLNRSQVLKSLHYAPPHESCLQYVTGYLAGYLPERATWKAFAEQAADLSYAEIARAAEDALKEALMHGRSQVDPKQLTAMLRERRAMRAAWKRSTG
jgi:hypothetical protein